MLTAKVRRFRVSSFIIITILLFLWGYFAVPLIMADLAPGLGGMGDLLLPYIGGLIEYIFVLLFAFFIMYQLSSSLQNLEQGQHDILLATPIKEGDIFLGEYLGKLPVYAWGIMFIVPLITGLLQNLFSITPLDIIIISLLVTLFIALAAWIGAIITGFVVKRLSKSARGKDFGKALTFIIAIIFFMGYYGFYFLGQEIMADPNFRIWFQISPSSWFANIINSIIGAPLVLSWFNATLSLFVILIFSVVIFLGGYRLAAHFYSLDIGGTQVQISILGENGFFRFIRRIMPLKWGTLVVANLKGFVRRKENLAKLAYAVVIIIFITVVQKMTAGEMSLGSSSFLDFLLIPWMLTIMLGTMLGSYIFVHSKDVLWVYKQSPRGIRSLVQGNLIAMLTLSFPLILSVCIFIVISNSLDIVQGIGLGIALFFSSCGALAMTMGIGSINPSYNEKSGKMGLNTLAFMGIQTVLFILMMIWASDYFFDIGPDTSILIMILLLRSFLDLGVGFPLLYLGMYRLAKIE